MKGVMSMALMFVCCAFCSSVNAETAQTSHKKIYVENKNIHLTEKGIFLALPEGIFEIKAIHSDQLGLFIYSEELNSAEKDFNHWVDRITHKKKRNRHLPGH